MLLIALLLSALTMDTNAFRQVNETSIAVVVPHDMALDKELWRWLPEDVTLFMTRAPYEPSNVTIDFVCAEHHREELANTTKSILEPSPSAVAYGCTSISFCRGLEGEKKLVEAMAKVGAKKPLTTSGAVLAAFKAMNMTKIAVLTPYVNEINQKLIEFLNESGITVKTMLGMNMTKNIYRVPESQILEWVQKLDTTGCDGIFISCTNVRTYNIIREIEKEKRVPVVSANQATIWYALKLIGRRAVGPGQSLVNNG